MVKAIQINTKENPEIMARINRLASVQNLKPRTAFLRWLNERLPKLPKTVRQSQQQNSEVPSA